ERQLYVGNDGTGWIAYGAPQAALVGLRKHQGHAGQQHRQDNTSAWPTPRRLAKHESLPSARQACRQGAPLSSPKCVLARGVAFRLLEVRGPPLQAASMRPAAGFRVLVLRATLVAARKARGPRSS